MCSSDLEGSQGFQGFEGDYGDMGIQGIFGDGGNTGAQGDQGVQGIAITGNTGSQGPPGPQGIQGPQGEKTAIVCSDGKYFCLYCTEMPETRMEAVLNISLDNYIHYEKIDDRFVSACCPNSILVCGYCLDQFAILSFSVKENIICIQSDNNTVKINLKISGIRRDTDGIKYPEYIKQQMDQNNSFWGSWR